MVPEWPDHHSGPEGKVCVGGPYAGAPEWFPRWAGRCVVIVASGPSASETPLDLIAGAGAACVVVNASHRLVPGADLLYAADEAFWAQDAQARAFPGLKVTQSEKAARLFGLHRVKLDPVGRSMRFDRLGEIGAGGNSGFQAVNLAAQAGAARIVLVGFDLSLAQGVHWHGKHPPGLNNPSALNMARWREDLDASAAMLAGLGVDVLNASPHSSLTAFEKRPLEACL